MNIGENFITEKERLNRIRWELDAKYSRRLNDLYNPMVDIINSEVIPLLVSQIGKNPPQPNGLVVLHDGTTKVCWELYNNKSWKNNPTFWMLFTSDGRFATSRTMTDENVWIYEEPVGLIHKDDPFHHYIFGTVRMFDSLLAIGKDSGLSERILTLWKQEFDLLYADYCRASEERLYLTRDE